jgi:hypothetical protein
MRSTPTPTARKARPEQVPKARDTAGSRAYARALGAASTPAWIVGDQLGAAVAAVVLLTSISVDACFAALSGRNPVSAAL